MSLLTWKKWINGVVGGFINAATGAVTILTADPDHWRKFLLPILVQGLTGSWLYLKEHPTPWDGIDRRGRVPWNGVNRRSGTDRRKGDDQ